MPVFAKPELSVLSPSHVAASGEALITVCTITGQIIVAIQKPLIPQLPTYQDSAIEP